jgi:hypothetical protein
MEKPENRMARATLELPVDKIEDKPEPKKIPVGIACKYCKAVANHPVKRTYPNKMRLRFCLSCRREFQTWEATV